MTGISKERMQKALEQEKTISKEDHAKVKALAGMVKMPRSFIFKNPDEYGMQGWHDLSIPSDDGTPLEAWYIPAKGGESNKLVIFNHALPMCRAGYPGHLGEPWSNFIEPVEIDFVIQYKHLTDAGYNVLTYDFRNHGQSGAANGGVCGVGQWEWRDCVGVKKFVDAHPRLGKMDVALFSQVLGRRFAVCGDHQTPGAVRERQMPAQPAGTQHDLGLLQALGLPGHRAVPGIDRPGDSEAGRLCCR